MEKTVLGMLGQLETAAQRTELKEQLRHHAAETEQQIRNLEQAFQAIGAEVNDKPSPAIEGIEKEGQALIKKAEDGLVDARHPRRQNCDCGHDWKALAHSGHVWHPELQRRMLHPDVSVLGRRTPPST